MSARFGICFKPFASIMRPLSLALLAKSGQSFASHLHHLLTQSSQGRGRRHETHVMVGSGV